MHHSTILRALVIGALSAAALGRTLAAATPWAIRRAQSGLFAGIGDDLQHYQETSGGAPLDSESGGLQAYTLGLTHLGRRSGRPYWRVQLSEVRGTTRYQANSPQGPQAAGSTTNRVIAAGARLGLAIGGLWRQDRDAVLIPYLGVGFHRWARGTDQGRIDPGGETYTEDHLGIGIAADYALEPRLVLSLHALTGYTLGAQVTATRPVFFDTATGTLQSARITQSLGDRPYDVIGGAIAYRVDHRLEIALHVRRAIWSAAGASPIAIRDSSGQTVGTTEIPANATAETTILLEASTPF